MSERGFTLIEAIATVALIGLTVLAASSMTAVHPVATDRLEAQREMLRVLDAVLEGVRSGEIPAVSGPVESPIPVRQRLSIELEARESDVPGLLQVAATARCAVRGRKMTRSLCTAMWRPR
jgi:prepilin-type N-terminal cleavage/methylation domain-containing protein